MLKSPISRALVIAGAGLLAITPFFKWGSPSGHDFEFHVTSWMEVLGQWKHGVIYPRWAALAHWGYGEARFLFYPPGSWTLGAALGAVLPWKMVPGAYCWLVLSLAGAAMYRLASEWLPARDALFAAVFYALNPYHLLIVYWRSAYAELLAGVLLPLLLLFLLRLRRPGIRPVLWLSLILAASWLTNAPAAVMIQYSAAGLALLWTAREAIRERSWTSQSWRLLIQTALAILLGAGLAAFYLLPAIYEQRWVSIKEVLSPGVRPQDNFLFTMLHDPDHNRFNLLVSVVAVVEMGVLALAIWGSRRNKRVGKAAASRPVAPSAKVLVSPVLVNPWMLLSVWGVATAFLMFSVSNQIWQHLPKFRYVQLPFRWLLCMNAALAMLLAMATKRWTSRLLVSAVLLATLVVTGYRTQPPWWETAGDIQELNEAVNDGTGYEGTDEYVPAGDDASELNKNLSLVSDDATAVRSEILRWEPTQKHFIVHAAAPQNLTVRLFNYPAWEVVLNGKLAETEKTEVTGLIVIPIAAGDNDIQIHFRRTTDRAAGSFVSLISLVLFVVFWFKPAWANWLWIKTRDKTTQPANLTSSTA